MLTKEDIDRIRSVCRELNSMGIKCNVEIEEFINYLSSPSYKPDSITIGDILGNKYLLIHELVEITLLKERGYSIDRNTIMKAYPDSYEAHLEAIGVELELAFRNGDTWWLKTRLNDLLSYLEDPLLPVHLVDKLRNLIGRYRSLTR